MRSFTTAECQLADENVALLVKAVKDSTAEVADTAALIVSFTHHCYLKPPGPVVAYSLGC